MRRAVIFLVSVLLAACAFGPRTIVVDQARLQSMLERQFPLKRSVFGVLELEVATPRLRLLPQQDRLATELELHGTSLLGGGGFEARLALDFGLRFEAADASVRMVRPHVESIDMGPGEGLGASAQSLAARVIERALADRVLWRVKPERIEALRAAGYVPGSLNVTERGLELRFEPAS